MKDGTVALDAALLIALQALLQETNRIGFREGILPRYGRCRLGGLRFFRTIGSQEQTQRQAQE